MIEAPYDDRDGEIWLNGSFVPWRSATVHTLNQGMHYGAAVFEGERAYDGQIFRSEDHTRRLLHSAKRLALPIHFSEQDIETAKREAVNRAGLESAYVRPYIFRGARQMGISIAESDVHVGIAVWHWGNYFDDKLEGIRLSIADWRRPPKTCAPTDAKAAGLYMICTLAKKAAEEAGFADALMLDFDGNIAEATGANVFFVRDGEIHTPRPDCFLNGITRQTVIELARGLGYTVIERVIDPAELPSFSECFITGSAAEVTPVKSIAAQSYNVGATSRALIEAYDAAVRSGRVFGRAVVDGSVAI